LEDELDIRYPTQEEVEFLRERVTNLEDTHSKLAEEVAALTWTNRIRLRHNQEYTDVNGTLNESLAAEHLRNDDLAVDLRTRINYIEIIDEVAEDLRARIFALKEQRVQQALIVQRLPWRRVSRRQNGHSRRQEYIHQILKELNQEDWN